MTGTRNFRPMRPWVYLLLFGALLAAGCSTSATNSSANLVDAQGNHPAGWISTHPSFVGAVGEACTSCHGEDLRGGISGVSCFTASFNGQACHAGGPAPANHQPVATWVNAHQGEAAALRPTFSGCNTALCHGATLQGAVGPSCFSPSFAGFLCHSGGPPPNFHVANWYVDHRAFAVANGTVSCATAGCHGATLHADPPAATGPSCFRATWGALSCHAGGPPTTTVPAGTHTTGWMNIDNTAAFHGTFAPGPPTCTNCHPIAGHPTCTTCHFDASGSRVSGAFNHVNAIGTHGLAQVSVGNICENCHDTSRTFRVGSPPSCLAGPGGVLHPGNLGCHSDPVIVQTLTNPRF